MLCGYHKPSTLACGNEISRSGNPDSPTQSKWRRERDAHYGNLSRCRRFAVS